MNKPLTMKMKAKQSGALLVELGVSLVILAILSVVGLRDIEVRINKERVDHASYEMEQILQAGVGYYVDNGAFPTKSQLIASGMIPSTEWASSLNGNYAVSTIGAGTTARFRVSLNTLKEHTATGIASNLPFGRTIGVGLSTAIGEVVIPATERSHEMLLARDGSNGGLTADLNANNNDIRNVNDIFVNRLCARGNTSFCVVPDGTSTMNTINANAINVSGDVSADGFIVNGAGTDLSESITYAGVVADNALFPKPTCKAGYIAEGFVNPVAFSAEDQGETIGGVQAWADSPNATQFRANMRIFTKDGWHRPSASYGYLTVFTKCTKL